MSNFKSEGIKDFSEYNFVSQFSSRCHRVAQPPACKINSKKPTFDFNRESVKLMIGIAGCDKYSISILVSDCGGAVGFKPIPNDTYRPNNSTATNRDAYNRLKQFAGVRIDLKVHDGMLCGYLTK